MVNNEIPTYYKFNANIRKFIDGLREDPIHTEPSQLLQDYGFTKDVLIRILMKRGIVKRKESIKDSTNSNFKKPTYVVRYTIMGDNYQEKTEQMYKDYIQNGKTNNTYPKQRIDEEGEGGAATSAGGGDGATGGGSDTPNGATNAESSGQYTGPLMLATGKSVTGSVINKPIGRIAENKKKRRIFITESQLCNLLNNESENIEETTTTTSVGDFAYDANPFKGSKQGDKFWKDAMSRPKDYPNNHINHQALF